MTRPPKLLLMLSAAIFSASAHGSTCLDSLFQDGFEDVSTNVYEVELVVSDLGSRSASFRLNGSATITVAADGTYCFAEQVPHGLPYEVSITGQPDSGNVCGSDTLTGVALSRVSIPIACTFSRTEWDAFDWDQANWN